MRVPGFAPNEWVILDSTGQAFVPGTNILPDGFEFLSEFSVWTLG